MNHPGVGPTVRTLPELGALWESKLLSNHYDRQPIPMAQKTGVTLGMAMTEKQVVHFGTDERCFPYVGANAKRCVVFFPSPLVSRRHAHRMQIQRLKDKCGNKSNASSEIERLDAWGIMIGEEGHGIRAILEMGHLCRQDFGHRFSADHAAGTDPSPLTCRAP